MHFHSKPPAKTRNRFQHSNGAPRVDFESLSAIPYLPTTNGTSSSSATSSSASSSSANNNTVNGGRSSSSSAVAASNNNNNNMNYRNPTHDSLNDSIQRVTTGSGAVIPAISRSSLVGEYYFCAEMSTIRAVYLGRHETSSFTEKATSSCWSLEEKLVERLESLQLAAKSTKQRVEADAMTSSSSEVVEEDEEEEQKVLVEVSRHGLKISSQRSRLVQCRIPMLELLLVTSYRDGFGRTNVGVVERAPNRFHLHVLQLPDDVTAHKLCALVKEVFVEAEEVNALIDTIEPPSPSLV